MNDRLIAALAGLALAACQATSVTSTPSVGSATAQPSPTAQSNSTPSPVETPSPEATVRPPASPAPRIGVESVVATTVNDLSLRRSPGIEGQRIGFLELGTVGFVLDGPNDVGGVPWYRITGMGLPFGSGCATSPSDEQITCPTFHGWVAGASEAGDPWLAPTDPGPCPQPTIRGISESAYTYRLVCWADDAITFDAWWPEIPDGAGLGGFCAEADEPGGFLYCQNTNYNGLNAGPDEGFVTRLSLSLDPADGVTMPERGQWVRVTGKFDHPAALLCRDIGGDRDPELAAFEDELACRLQFVPSSVEPLGS